MIESKQNQLCQNGAGHRPNSRGSPLLPMRRRLVLVQRQTATRKWLFQMVVKSTQYAHQLTSLLAMSLMYALHVLMCACSIS